MTRAGTLRGRVAAATALAPRTRVVAEPLEGVAATRRLPSAIVNEGAFFFDSLAAGRYRLRIPGMQRGVELYASEEIIEITAGSERFLELD